MKLEINLDESRFKDLVDEELGNFSDAEIHDILAKAISQYAMEKDVIQKLFYNKKRNYYGNETDELEATPRLERIVQNLDMEEVLGKLKKDIQDVLSEDDVIKRLAENLFYRFLSNKINEMLWNSSTLQSMVQVRANEMLENRLKNK
jgi:glutaredoxin 2